MRKVHLWLLALLAILCSGTSVSWAADSASAPQGTLVAKAKSKSKKGKGGSKSKKKPTMHLDKREVQTRRDLKSNVRSYRDQVWITRIPMVDQGQEKSCAVATLQRVLCYFTESPAEKPPISNESLKKKLGYSSKKGTNLGEMMETLRRNASSLHLSCDEIYSTNMTDKAMLQTYNRYAERKKANGKKVSISEKKADKDIKIEDYVTKIDYSLWRRMRCNELDEGRKHVWRRIRESVDRGLPILWTMELGLYQETGLRQKGGGHMRLIIGYDKAAEKIIYSDSWGMGHEKKEMPWDDAWAITSQMMVLKPR